METEIAIDVEHVSKKYCKSQKRSMIYGMQDITRNTFGFSSKPEKLRNSEFWAVDDVSFEVKKGESLGIIGPNGAGKTTLLKMLNGIFWPDKGKITIKDKVGALIAVGAGFHPMLSGKDNIFINGAVLGMSKSEINKKFDSIVDFADIGDFLNSPVRFYSSGMFVRLGFSIAVHCEPDVLLVDEILAVGDIEFQNKCINKIGELMSNGTTIALVSHNLVYVRRVCEKCLWIDSGKIVKYGNTLDLTNSYQTSIVEKGHKINNSICKDEDVHIERVVFFGKDRIARETFSPNEPITVGIIVNAEKEINNLNFEIKLKSMMGIEIFHFTEPLVTTLLPNSKRIIEFSLEGIPISNDIIMVNMFLWNENMTKLYARRSGHYFFRMAPEGQIKGHLDVPYSLQIKDESEINFSDNNNMKIQR
ncbi:polysaccharide ABC transporter ATP-binding protein [Acidobacteriota bacterium]